MGGGAGGYSEKKPSPFLVKWWKAHQHVDGLVTEQISPYQQKIISPLFKNIPHKLTHRLSRNWYVFIPIIAFTAVRTWADNKHEEIDRHHWA